ncbi:MAG TPA: hypothetical protein VGD38_17325, partial [Pyrinomonadaceae bacterium]
MKSILFGTLLLLSLTARAGAQEPAAPTATPAPQSAAQSAGSSAEKYFTDVILVNQDGEKMRFYSDLIKGKTVVINSFFAT